MKASGMSYSATHDEVAHQFNEVRPMLVDVAYRLLGSIAEAEYVVQDVWFRWQGTNRSEIPFPTAFLITVTIRLAFDCLESTSSRRETYIGLWLPEPVDTSQYPHVGAQQDEMLSFAVLLLMEKLNPKERAAYILREVLDYSYARVAAALQTSEDNARQLVIRARRYLNTE